MKGSVAFEAHYQSIFQDRWPSLKAALLQDKQHVVVLAPGEALPAALASAPELPWFPRAFALKDKVELPGVRCYFMDAASLLPVQALELKAGECVLDLCAAPGGKSLLMAWQIGHTGQLVANDRSPDRRGRLKKTLETLTVESERPLIKVTGHEAGGWGLHEKNRYDKVLLDAPCSSERHVLEDSKELENWSPKRPQRLAKDQFTMLCAALEAVKVGGYIVYSTCALELGENDGVVQKLLERRVGRVELAPWPAPLGESTAVGQRVLPDREGWGPFYLARLRKVG